LGAGEVCSEWIAAAQLTLVAEGFQGARTLEESAVITAIVLRYRCLVNFVSGGYKGTWADPDIRPSDFLGHDWQPSDEQLDRTMRGRLAVLNTEQQHISWKRLDGAVTIWHVGFLMREVGVALAEFSDLLERLGKPGALEFGRARATVEGLLTPRAFDSMTAVDLAPPR
jgi:hypothetical protein